MRKDITNPMSDPAWVAAIAAWVAAFAALVTMILTVVLAVANQHMAKANRDLVRIGQEQLQVQHRPMLTVSGELRFQEGNASWLTWDESDRTLSLRNVGAGVAFNIASVIYGSESYPLGDISSNKRDSTTKDIHWTCWLGTPIAPNESASVLHKIGNGVFFESYKKIGAYSLNAPALPSFGQSFHGAASHLARAVVTYHDVSGQKHASIFDYVQHIGWQLIAFLPNITEDLHDLEGEKSARTKTSAKPASGLPQV